MVCLRNIRDGGIACILASATIVGANAPALAQTSSRSIPPAALLTQPADPADYYRQSKRAAELLDQKQWSEAEAILKRLTAEYPFDTAISLSYSNWGRFALALREQKKYAQAIGAYRKVIELQGPGLSYPAPSNARYWIAFCQLQLGDTRAALDTLDAMVKQDRYVARAELFDDPNFAVLKSNSRFQSIAGKLNATTLDRVTGWRIDIDYLESELKRDNPPDYRIPAEFFHRAEALKASVPQLNDEQVALGMGRVLNALDRGHTAIWFGAPGTRAGLNFKPLPIRLYAFPEGIFITEGKAGSEDLAGAQVLRFGTATAAEALARVGEAGSHEGPEEILWVAPQLLTRPGVLKGLGFTPRADEAELRLKLANGTVVSRTLQVVDEPPRTDWSERLNPPPGVKPPLFLAHITRNHWFEFLPEHDAAYVQLSNVLPDGEETMPQFGLKVREALSEKEVHNLILDLRHNNGGNTFTYVELLRTIVAFGTKPGHTVYVLIGRNVYSACANLVTDLERLARPVFVGEPTSGAGNQWGDESEFVLPYSGIMGSFSGVKWQLSHPWDQRRSVVPQVPVQLTAKAFFAGEDPVLTAAFRLMSTTKPTTAIAEQPPR